MKCVHCGGEFTADQLQENQGACPHCGQPQQMEADPQPEETKEPTSDPQEKPDKPETAAPHKRSSLPLIVGAVVIILALAAVLWAVLGTGGQQVTAEQHNNPTVLTGTPTMPRMRPSGSTSPTAFPSPPRISAAATMWSLQTARLSTCR